MRTPAPLSVTRRQFIDLLESPSPLVTLGGGVGVT